MSAGAIPTFEQFKASGGIPSFEEFKAASAPKETPIGEQPASVSGVAQTMGDQASRFLSAAWENLNPANLVKAGLHPINTAHAAFGATVDALDRTEKALKSGDHKEALTSMVGAIPLLGPAGEQIVREIEEGKHAEALGHAAGLRLAFESPKLLKASAPVVAGAIQKAADVSGPLAKGVAAAVPEIPVFPKTIGDLSRPFRAAGDAFTAARDAQAAEHVAGVPAVPVAAASPAAATESLFPWKPAPQSNGTPLRPPLATRQAVPQVPQAPPPEPVEPRWDPSTLPPDPLASDPKFIEAARNLIARRSGRATPPAAGHTIQEQLQQYLESQRPKPAPITDPNAPLTPEASAALTDKLNKLNRDLAIEAGDNPNLHLGEVKGGKYLNRFVGSDSPVIDSGKRKPGSTAPVANPSKLKIVSPSPAQLRASPAYMKLLKSNPAAARAAMDLAMELQQ